ncbi:STAS domain-containing protein [Nonomuraea basaltis]|uniref:STAS domain-containing protein n=1 Tax=Nonomuraea basaltis TaxID=2495887 RepID=UPI001485ECF0|nr:STAS domain-containing protein [Nonomuraea basaltis]
MSERLDVTEFLVDCRVVVVTVRGVLDLDSCPVLQVRLAHAVALRQPPRLAIDLSGLTSADSFGLTVLLATERHVRSAGGRLVVCEPGDLLWRTFRDRGLDRVLDTRQTLAAAVRDLQDGRRAG